MCRSLGRTFAALFALWFAISLAEPAALHSCQMHGADAASAHAHGAVSHHADAPEHSSPANENGSQHCTCLGSCSASSANTAIPGVGASVEAVPSYALVRHAPTLRARVVTAPPFFLPYANGPPRPATVA